MEKAVSGRGPAQKGIEWVASDGRIYHPLNTSRDLSLLDVVGESKNYNGHFTKLTMNAHTGEATLWISRRDEEFKQTQKSFSVGKEIEEK